MNSLGRYVQHDPRSLAFAAARAPALVTTLHKRHSQPFDQGNLGSCTGNAMAGLLVTEPYWQSGRRINETTAVKLYKYATGVDNVPGAYPPVDTGSTGLAAAKAAQHYGYITAYDHAFGLQHALEALVLGPVAVGVNWYSGFDKPNKSGLVKLSGFVRGGHEFELVGLDVDAQTVRACNSWGSTWADGGYFSFSWTDLDRLLSEQGDVTTIAGKVRGVDIHVYHHFIPDTEQLNRIEQKLNTLIKQEAAQMATLEDLTTEVQQNGDAVASAVTLLNGLSQQLQDAIAANDPAAIQALADSLAANTQSLADAVTANTPAAP